MEKLFTTENIKNIGLVGLLSLIIITGSTGVWVWGTTYQEVKADRDEWKKTALDGLRVARDISPVRLPILSRGPSKVNVEVRPEDIKRELAVIHSMNGDK
jgi:hypothetical protein